VLVLFINRCQSLQALIKLHFDNVGEGLVAKNDKLKEFEIAGKDGRYVKADAKIVNNEVLVSSSFGQENLFQ
jgi:hypothetical protein